MRNPITSFDLTAAFTALANLPVPVAAPTETPDTSLVERVVLPTGTDNLCEDYYNLSSQRDFEAAKEQRELDIALAKLAKIEKIVDLDAKSPEDLLPSYVGKIIIQCPQCMTLFYKDLEDIVVSEEDPTVVNVDEICQHCGNDSGYTQIGKVGGVEDETTESEVEEPAVDELATEADVEEPVEDVSEEESVEVADETTAEEALPSIDEIEEDAAKEEEVAESLNEDVVSKITDQFCSVVLDDTQVFTGTKEECEKFINDHECAASEARGGFKLLNTAEVYVKKESLDMQEALTANELGGLDIFKMYNLSGRDLAKIIAALRADLSKEDWEALDEAEVKDFIEMSGGVVPFILTYLITGDDKTTISREGLEVIIKSDDKAMQAVRDFADKYKFFWDGEGNPPAVEISDEVYFDTVFDLSLTEDWPTTAEELVDIYMGIQPLTEAVDIDDQMDAYNDYIKYLQVMIEQEEEALENAKNDLVKEAIKRRLDAFKLELENALPDVVTSEITVVDLPTPGAAEKADDVDPVEGTEEAKESLNEDGNVAQQVLFNESIDDAELDYEVTGLVFDKDTFKHTPDNITSGLITVLTSIKTDAEDAKGAGEDSEFANDIHFTIDSGEPTSLELIDLDDEFDEVEIATIKNLILDAFRREGVLLAADAAEREVLTEAPRLLDKIKHGFDTKKLEKAFKEYDIHITAIIGKNTVNLDQNAEKDFIKAILATYETTEATAKEWFNKLGYTTKNMRIGEFKSAVAAANEYRTNAYKIALGTDNKISFVVDLTGFVGDAQLLHQVAEEDTLGGANVTNELATQATTTQFAEIPAGTEVLIETRGPATVALSRPFGLDISVIANADKFGKTFAAYSPTNTVISTKQPRKSGVTSVGGNKKATGAAEPSVKAAVNTIKQALQTSKAAVDGNTTVDEIKQVLNIAESLVPIRGVEDDHVEIEITDIAEADFERVILEKLKATYSNITNFKLIACSECAGSITAAELDKSRECLILEGEIEFTSGNRRPITYVITRLELLEDDNLVATLKLAVAGVEEEPFDIYCSVEDGCLKAYSTEEDETAITVGD